MTNVAVSGGFDPLHIGHVRLFQEAAKLGRLVVIVNNDNWLRAKKGFSFMPQSERAEIIRALACVHSAILTDHGPNPLDMSIRRTLALLNVDVFANGGDRVEGDVPEEAYCNARGIKLVYNVGGPKVQSSSKLTAREPAA